MSNIIYRVLMAPQEENETRLIDSNDLVRECIDERRKSEEKRIKKAAVAEAPEDGFAPLEGAEGIESYEGDDAVNGYTDAETDDVLEEEAEPQIDYVAQAQAQAEEILADAQAQADAILSTANEQADAIRSHAEAEGQKSGYEQGLQEAVAKQQELLDEAAAERDAMLLDVKKQGEALEGQLVDVITEVVERVFLVQFGDSKELIYHAVDQALSGIEGSREFMIRVGESNLEFLRAHKDELQEKVGSDLTLDIVLDPLLDETQCMIETDGGLFDCSMDTQMRNLSKAIRSLS